MLIVRSSDSWAMSIHRFIESIATKRALRALLADLALEVGLDVGEEDDVGGRRLASDSDGWKCSKTLRSVWSVWRTLTSRS